MANIIELEAVDNENTRKMLARKILANRTDIPYTHLLEQLETGGVDYYCSQNDEKDTEFDRAISDLDELGVKYKITQKESETPQKSPELEEEPAPHPHNSPHTPHSAVERNVTQNIAAIRPTASLPIIENPIEVLGEETPPKKINAVLSGILTALGIGAVLLLMFYFSNIKSQPKHLPELQDSRQLQQQADAQYNKALGDADRACMDGALDTEKMYRFAISFNKYNIKAWLGLLNCFEKKGDGQKIAEVREEIRSLFGDNVFAVARIVSAYGTIENFSEQDRACRISYVRSSSSSDDVERELFAVASGVENVEAYDRAVIYAKDGGGGSMISVSFADFPQTFEEFKEKIVVNRVGN